MTVPTTYQGEVQFRRYSDTSTQGTQIVLALPDREALQPFLGLEGKRFMAVLVQIGDDEQPVDKSANLHSQLVDKTPKTHIREPLGDLCYRAVQWCGDPEFWAFLNATFPAHHVENSDEAGILVKDLCGVDSRKALDTDERAKEAFHRLIRGPYHRWAIARGSKQGVRFKAPEGWQ